MDPITHGLTGALVGQLGFRQRIGRDASWVAAAVAMAADLDLFFTRQGDVASLGVHRGPTHSLVAIPIIALIGTVIWWRIRASRWERRPFGWMFLCTLLAAATHPAIDVMTTYGTLILWPFSNQRIAFDAIPIIDVIFTSNLAVALISCYIVGRFFKKWKSGRFILAWAGLVSGIAYMAMGLWLHGLVLDYAKKNMEAAMGLLPLPRIESAAGTHDSAPSISPDVEYRAYPRMGTIFKWRVTRSSPKYWMAAAVNASAPQPLGWHEALKTDDTWVQRARQLPEARKFDWFAMGQTRAESILRDGNHVVVFHDMRYGREIDSVDSIWRLAVTFHDPGQPPDARMEYMKIDRSKLLKDLWHELF